MRCRNRIIQLAGVFVPAISRRNALTDGLGNALTLLYSGMLRALKQSAQRSIVYASFSCIAALTHQAATDTVLRKTMRLTQFSDYSLRVLMYAAAQHGRLVTIEETAAVYQISRNHLMKVVNMLTRTGYLKTVRGRAGGFMLAVSPDNIRLGTIMRVTEPDFAMAECFTADSRCQITPSCRLRGVLREALEAFIATLDRYTLKDLLLRPEDFGLTHGKR